MRTPSLGLVHATASRKLFSMMTRGFQRRVEGRECSSERTALQSLGGGAGRRGADERVRGKRGEGVQHGSALKLLNLHIQRELVHFSEAVHTSSASSGTKFGREIWRSDFCCNLSESTGENFLFERFDFDFAFFDFLGD